MWHRRERWRDEVADKGWDRGDVAPPLPMPERPAPTTTTATGTLIATGSDSVVLGGQLNAATGLPARMRP